jgi:hypothetical protein
MEVKKGTDLPALRIVSYNIAEFTRDKLANLALQCQSADILCLTNVSAAAYELLNNTLQGFSSFQVFLSDAVRDQKQRGTVIYCNKKTVMISEDDTPYYFDYEGASGRILGTGIYHKRTRTTFNVLTAELDVNNEAIRKRQVETLQKVIIDMDNYVLLGDLGELPLKLHDAWIKLGCPGRVKYTVDGQQRLTRIYYKSRVLIPKVMSLLGTNLQLGPNYGVETILQIKKASSSPQF